MSGKPLRDEGDGGEEKILISASGFCGWCPIYRKREDEFFKRSDSDQKGEILILLSYTNSFQELVPNASKRDLSWYLTLLDINFDGD